jgi:hypothetical protein
MNNIQNSQVQTEELVDTFSDIDGRISELHQHSSGVFMQLNSYLKEYYKKINIISENASTIFDSILGNEKNILIDELNNLYKEIKNYRIIADEENKKSFKLLNEINVKGNQISMSIRNFKQDMITFKYLITNYHLVSNYEKFDPEWNESVERWSNKTSYIQPWLTTIGKELADLKIHVGSFLETSKSSNTESSENISGLSDEIRSIYNNVLEKNQQSEVYFPVLKEKSKRYSDSIGNIITHLQYHDIIRQKTEHIQQSHLTIINTLKKDDEQEKPEENKPANQSLGHIADIVGIQAEQLILVSREYQNAIEIITRNFQIIADDINTISNISNELCTDDKNRDITLLKQVKNKLDEGIVMLDINNISLLNTDLLIVRDKIRSIHKLTLNTVTEPLTLLEKSELFKGRKLVREGIDKDTNPSIIFQIASLAKELSTKKNHLQQKIDDLLELSEMFKTSEDNNGQGSEPEQEQIRLMVKLTRILDKLDEDDKKLDSVLSQNGVLNHEIINEIEGTINKVDYYELFEKVLNNVIGKLNYVNARLRDDSPEGLSRHKEDIKDLQSLYTVASERIIHNNFINGENSTEINPDENPSDDVELF